MSNQVQRLDAKETLPQVVSDSSAIMAVISRAASDPQCDIEKMERLMAMHERMQATNARSAFNAAMAEMQCDIPSIAERGTGHNKMTYATLEDIVDVTRPVLKQHGFAVSFKVEHHQGGVNVTGVLMHRDGHREETTILLPSDTSGNKNGVQAVGSTISYGKRYALCALLNIVTRGEDDDGVSASPKARTVTPVQAAQLEALLAKCSEETQGKFIDLKGPIAGITHSEFDSVLIQLTKAAARDSRVATDADH
jgi:hypothetical protein